MRRKKRESITQTARRVLQSPATMDLPAFDEVIATPGGDDGKPGIAAPQSMTLSGQQFEDLLEREECIFAIRSEDTAATLRQFENYVRQSGKAAYLWNPEKGLTSLKVNDMGVPGSLRLLDALRYVAHSRHYGVYAFINYQRQLDLNCLQLMRDITGRDGGHERKVVLVSQDPRLPSDLLPFTARVIHEPERRLRLRDGRWVA